MPANAYKLAAMQRNKSMDLKGVGSAMKKKKSTKKQGMKARRDESYGAWGKRKGGKVNKPRKKG